MWSKPLWVDQIYGRGIPGSRHLEQYAKYFNSVEGNTSFYHLPGLESIHQWNEMVDQDFRFTFKFPKDISHQAHLADSPELLHTMFERFAVLEDKLGCLMLQLPASFSPVKLPELRSFLSQLPKQFKYAVEVRHMGFFDKGENEKQFNHMLMELDVNRVIMDTRGLFACKDSKDPLVRDVQGKKPKVPTNVIATATSPIIRVVGHPDLEQNEVFMLPWIHKIQSWLEQGLTPYLFFHMPDNNITPWLAEAFFTQYREVFPDTELPQFTLPQRSVTQFDIFD